MSKIIFDNQYGILKLYYLNYMKIILLVYLILVANLSKCCECDGPKEINDRLYDFYNVILIGKIINIEKRNDTHFLVIKVDTYYKGDTTKKIIKIYTPPEQFCGLVTRIGEKWLIYAYVDSFNSKPYLLTDICTRSKTFNKKSLCCYKMDEMKRDLAFLEGKKSKKIRM
jgi:hypothetical protein